MKIIKYITIVALGIAASLYFIHISFYRPTKVNALIASIIYKAPANSDFKDINFYKMVIRGYNNAVGPNGPNAVPYTTNLSTSQLEKIKSVWNTFSADEISELDLTGIEKLTNLDYLYILCTTECNITNADFTNNTKLTSLTLDRTKLSEIDLSNNILLEELTLFDNDLSEIDLTNNTNLNYLRIDYNDISSLNLENNVNIESLFLPSNHNIKELDCTSLTNLTELNIDLSYFDSVDLSKNTNLTVLSASGSTIPALDLSNNKKLKQLDLRASKTKALKLFVDNLNALYLSNSALEYDNDNPLDLRGATNLSYLDIRGVDFYGKEYDIYYGDEIDINNTDTDIPLYLPSHFSSPQFSSATYGYTEENGVVAPKAFPIDFPYIQRNYSFSDSSTTRTYTIRNKINLFNLRITLGKNNYIIGDDYLLIANKDFQIGDFYSYVNTGCENCHDEYENGYLSIYKGERLIKSFEVIIANYGDNFLEEARVFRNVNNSFDIQNISFTNCNQKKCSANMDDDEVNILVNGESVMSYPLLSINSEYDLNSKYLIFIDNEDGGFDLDKITVTNGEASISDNTLTVKYNNTTVFSIPIVTIGSSYYKVTKDYIYLKNNKNALISRSCPKNLKCNAISKNNKIQIISGEGEVLYELDKVSISSDTEDLTKDYLWGTDITAINADILFVNDPLDSQKIQVKYGGDDGEIIDEFDLLSISIKEGNSVYSNDSLVSVIVNDETIEDFLSSDVISVSNLRYGIYNEEENKTEGAFEEGDTIRFFYKDEMVKELGIVFPVSSINIIEDNIKLSINKNNSYNLNYEIFPSYASNKNVIWSSQDENVATVSSNGVVDAKTLGETTILVTAENGKITDSVTVSTYYNVEKIALDKSSISLDLKNKNKFKLEPIFYPEYSENKMVSWTSSDENVATVDEHGIVEAKSIGNAIITITSEDGGYKANCEVNVLDTILYDVTFIDGDNTHEYNYESDMIIDFSNFNKDGYTLTSYKYKNNIYTIDEELLMPEENIEIELIYERNKYQITYNTNNETKTVTYDEAYGELLTPSKKGHTFNGWYLENTYDNLITKDSIVNIYENHLLYAKFDINTYRLTINKNGGTSSQLTSLDLKYNQQLVNEVPLKKGYEFIGWDVEGKDSAINGNIFTMGTSDSTLTALWKIIVPKIHNYEINNSFIKGIGLKTNVDSLDLKLDSIYDSI